MNLNACLVFVCFAALLTQAPDAISQAPNQPGPRLQQLVSAKILPGESPKVVMMIESFRKENHRVKSTTEIFVVQEDGSEKPLSDPKVRSRVTVKVRSAGLKPITVDAKQFKFYDLDWKAVSSEDATKRLTKLKSVFLLDAGMTAGKFSMAARAALQEDCMILVTQERIRERDAAMGRDPFANPFGGGDPFN